MDGVALACASSPLSLNHGGEAASRVSGRASHTTGTAALWLKVGRPGRRETEQMESQDGVAANRLGPGALQLVAGSTPVALEPRPTPSTCGNEPPRSWAAPANLALALCITPDWRLTVQPYRATKNPHLRFVAGYGRACVDAV